MATITLYTLNQSRSQRIAWLLETLGLDYEAVIFERDSNTKLAPPELQRIHPLGKSPIVKDGDKTLVESGAIVEYLIERYGKKTTLKPDVNSDDYASYLQWVHYAEGSLAFALIANMYAGESFAEFCQAQVSLHVGYVEAHLAKQHQAGKAWFVSDKLTGADILMSFPLQVVSLNVPKAQCPHIHRFVQQVESHPSYLKANEKIGELNMKKLTS